jgi:Protein of unknown function (DUF3180)
MKPTRLTTLALAALICAVLAWLLLRLVYTSLPPLPWTGVPALLLLAIAEAVSGRNVRARLRGSGGTRIPPIAVARMAALAKASSLAAALIGGLAAGFLVYVLGSLDKPAFRTDAVTAAVTLGSAMALAAGALYLEHGCRVPPRSDEDEDTGPPPSLGPHA